MPEALRKDFERKTLREGYLLNLDGMVQALVFFRGAYQARVREGGDAYLCRYRHAPQSAAPPRGNSECECSMSTTRSRCAHQAALLFRVLSDARGKPRSPAGSGYPESLWSYLALCVCRSHSAAGRLRVEGGKASLVAEGLPVLDISLDAASPAWDESDGLPEGWESSARPGGFAAWARAEINATDRLTLKTLGHAPAQRAEYGAAGQLARAAFLAVPTPRGRLDWEEDKGLFRVRLHGERSAFEASALLNLEQAYSLHRKFPGMELGKGFPESDAVWSKGLEVRVAEGSRLRIRPFAVGPVDGDPGPEGREGGDGMEAASAGRSGGNAPEPGRTVTRAFPPDEGEGPRFGDMPWLPGIGFRRLRSGDGSLFRRYTGWKTYWVEAAAVPDFLRKHGEELAGPACDTDPRLGNPQAAPIASLTVRVRGREGNRFRVDLEYRIGDTVLDLATLKGMREAGLPCLITSAGWVEFSALEWAWAGQVKAEDWISQGERNLVVADAPFLARLCVLHGPRKIEVEPDGHPGLDFLTSLAEGDGSGGSPGLAAAVLVPEAELPAQGLRPYQAEGLRWLAHLAALGLSGILADDMGLGKTHQVMALLAWMRRRSGGKDRALIVCPTSVLYHWKERIAAFHAELDAGVFHGSARDPEILDAEICITSYGIVRNDIERFRSRRYALLILDEVHYSKNRDSETHRSLRDFPARTVIGLTGTPLENDVWEVKNLFDLILPGYFPGEARFRRDIAEPLETAAAVSGPARRGGSPGLGASSPAGAWSGSGSGRTGSSASAFGADGSASAPAIPAPVLNPAAEAARTRLLRLVRPFLLRRTKAQVLTDLPAKSEENYVCEMAAGQAALYHAVLRQRGAPLLRELSGAKAPSLLHVFRLLNHLKQICNHPLTLAGESVPEGDYGSGKWDLFVFLLEKSLAAGRKVVVFSQYLRMLDWIGNHLRKNGVGFASLTGSTADRPAVLKRFANDPECRVFCCSLKAGGVGIDLTAAETVIHYDRWWNAARENQATDRVHRIGQTKNVQVFKLITRGTVEERIDAIIRRKAAWMDELVPDDPEGGLKLFTREELMEVLRGADDPAPRAGEKSRPPADSD